MTTRTLALLFGASLAAFGCSGDKGDSGAAAESDADADADADSDTDADADADADADGDIDEDNPFVLDVTATISEGSEVTDQCAGRTEASDDGSTVSGAVYCAFSGGLASFIPGEQEVPMEGTMDGSGGASGTFTLTNADPPITLTFDWTATYDDAEFDGAVAGETTLDIEGVGSIPVVYSGTFGYKRQ
jgi:hypothetical protein